MISLQTNTTSLFAQQALNNNTNFESNTIEQLTSGYRINNSGDDAAGLAVANQYSADIAELNQGVLNASQGSSALQIVDGGLSNISQILDRLQTLATESASGTFDGDRSTLNTEFQTLLGEINTQAQNIGLATGGTTTQGGQIGTSQYNNAVLNVFIGGGADVANNADSAVSINLTSTGTADAVTGVDVAGLGLDTTTNAGDLGDDVSSTSDAQTALTDIETAISRLGEVQGAVGASENLLNYATSLANSQITNLSSAESSIRDANVAQQAANLAQSQTLEQSSIAALAQANAMPAALLKLLQ